MDNVNLPQRYIDMGFVDLSASRREVTNQLQRL